LAIVAVIVLVLLQRKKKNFKVMNQPLLEDWNQISNKYDIINIFYSDLTVKLFYYCMLMNMIMENSFHFDISLNIDQIYIFLNKIASIYINLYPIKKDPIKKDWIIFI
jgi:hypothetical protein